MSFQVSITPEEGFGNRQYQVTVTAINGWIGMVQLSRTLVPNASSSLDAASLTFTNGGPSVLQTFINVGNIIQNTVLTVRGDSGPLNASDTVNLLPGRFEVNIQEATGGTGSVLHVDVTSIDNFRGAVSMSRSPTTIATLSATSVFLTEGSTGSLTCQVAMVMQPTTLTIAGFYSQGSASISDNDTCNLS